MTAATLPTSPLSWTCGACQAKPGERCATRTGRTTATHSDRRRSVELNERYGRPMFDRARPAAARLFAETAAARAQFTF